MRSILLLILLLFQSNSLKAQEGSGDQTFNTILFKVSSSENDRVSYLFGTHHAFGKSFFDTLTKANQALHSSDLLIKENLNIPGEMAEDLINRRSTTTKWNKLLNREDLSFIEALFLLVPLITTK
ncbi:TraB/GumN family protein [Algoriphagus halophilus]|uniref:TraB/GumN family protein n=1 Tax=Algoriphagus halophilus TaxID=226505 RepID=UPI00358EDCDC